MDEASRTKVAHFEDELALVNQDVVRLDVAMEDATAFHEFEGEQQLLRVGAHRLDVQAHVLAVALQHLTHIHTAAGQGGGSN